MQVYRADNVLWQLAHEGVYVTRCRIERTMHKLGLRGSMRGKAVRATVGDAEVAGPPNRANLACKQFDANRHRALCAEAGRV